MNVGFEVHESHIPLWEDTSWRYAILCGGRGNGRSGSASRYALSQLLGKEYTRGAIMRATSSDIRASCWSEIIDRVNEQKIQSEFRIADNDMFIERGENSIRGHGFRASSGSLTARLKSLAGYNFIWIEEAEEIGEDEFRKLDDTIRTVKGRIRIIFTLNTPPKSHWIIKKWFDTIPSGIEGFYVPQLKESVKDVLYIPGTYKENEPNMDKHTVERYEEYKHNNPAHYYQVIKGLSPEEVRGKIYSGWQMIDKIPEKATLKRFGIDWGWSPDPMVLSAIYEYGGSYYIKQLLYDTLIQDETIADEIKKTNGWRGVRVVCGVDGGKSIDYLKKNGITAVKAITGQGSVDFRIKTTSQKKVFVERAGTKLWESYENYRWAEDKDGNPKGEPDHHFSDGMDSCFAPETLVHTTKGKIRIDELLGKEGFLYSRNNTIQRFYNVRPTTKDTEVVRLTFNDGNTLSVTPNHLLLLPNGKWIRADLLCVSDMIQSSMYEQTKIQWNYFYKIHKQKVLLWLREWKKMVSASLRMVFNQWGDTKELSYSSQGWRQGKQFFRKPRVETSFGSSLRTHDSRTQGATEAMDKSNITNDKEMAWVKRGDRVAQATWKECNGKKKTYTQKMFSLPQKLFNNSICKIHKILWAKLPNESKTKTIIGIARGFCKQTYNLEVEKTHCLMANGVVAHNCSYALADINPIKEIVMPRPSGQRNRPKVNLGL